jgi:lipoprotein-anchoring transpeptidase ErfK/SrfK
MTQYARFLRGPRLVAVAAVAVVLGLGAAGTAVAGPGNTEGTPCSTAARACVELDANKAWLIKDGKVERGPVAISHGGPGADTPRGDFSVQRKDKDHKSAEFNNAPMPWAVFFAPGGIAFHEGRTDTPSAGCVRLAPADAQAWFESLQVGDKVEVR